MAERCGPQRGDFAARATARGEGDGLSRSLFVEAGAGCGKTSVLVDRVVALVLDGTPMRHIAAVTFTEKAAAELRDRIRVALTELPPGEQTRAALEELDTAAIGTLHSFARRVLSHHPVEVGLPPLLDLLDDVASSVAADRRFDTTRAILLEDPAAAAAIRIAMAAGLSMEDLRGIARALDADWDLVEERLAGDVEPHISLTVRHEEIVRGIDALLARRIECTDRADVLCARLDELVEAREAIQAAIDATERFVALGAVGRGCKHGKKGNWPGVQLPALRHQLTTLCADAESERARVVDAVTRDLLHRLAARCLAEAQARRASGRLEFHDLLVLARRLLRSPEHGSVVRAALARRYHRLLLDEFQDTDPIQVELAVRIAGGAGAGAEDWRDVEVPAGSLFLVGDPKQSIYRFRRADITTYLQAAARLGEPLTLSTNFRSSAAVLGWINTVFGRLIQAEPDTQPNYVPLDAAPNRADLAPDAGPAVVVLGEVEHGDEPKADELRRREAADVATLLARALSQSWQVADRTRGWATRDLTRGDITVLVPTRGSLPELEEALDAVGLAYRTEAASLVYSAPEVRELHLVARAVDDPTDQLAVVGALRSAVLGCGDDDLWRWKAAHGSWDLFARAPEGVASGDPVRAGIGWLRELASLRSVISPSALLDRILVDRQVLEAAVDSPRYRETWRRLRFVVDQARAWSEAEHGSLREYLIWAERQGEDTARVSEVVLPETDADAIRITTIHAAKGLQFPFVVVSGLSSTWKHPTPSVIWTSAGGCEVRLRKTLATSGYAAAAEAEKIMEHREDLRLLYVACTRAESHLAVSLHRATRKQAPASELSLSLAEQLAVAAAGAHHESWSAPADRTMAPSAPPVIAAELSRTDWEAQRTQAMANMTVRQAESATDIAHGRARSPLPSLVVDGLDKQARDLELPAWAKGRYGTAVGRAVHAVLQSVDLATGAGSDALAAAQSLAEGIPDQVELVQSLVRSALDCALVKQAAVCEHWRETYVGTVVDGVLVEGYVDLLYRDADGLVLVDFKTDAAVTEQALSAYATQLSVYARAVADAAGEPVTLMVLLFVRPGKTVAYPVRSSLAIG